MKKEEKNEEYYTKKIYEHFKGNENVEIVDFSYMEGVFGIKILICDKKFVFHYTGTIDELIDDIESELQEKEQETGTCPFCGKSTSYLNWERCDQCSDCGSVTIQEMAKPNNLTEIMEEIDGREIITSDYKKYKIWLVQKDKIKMFDNLNNEKYIENKFNEYINTEKYNEHNLSDNIFDNFKSVDEDIDIDRISTLSKDYFYRLIYNIGISFCVWINTENHYNLNYSKDSYDHSGELDHEICNKYFKIKKFDNIYDWMEATYTGNYTNTYCSGYGRSYDTISDGLSENAREYALKILLQYYGKEYKEYDDLPDSSDNLEIEIEYYLMDNVIDYLKSLSPIQCWLDYLKS